MAEQNGSSDPGHGPDYDSAEYRAYRRAVDRGDVSFHQVASAWFDWHWGPDDCPECFGYRMDGGRSRDIERRHLGRRWRARPPPSSPSAPASNGTGFRTRCAMCQGRGRYHQMEGRAYAYEEIFHELLETFSEQRGGLITAYFCENIRVAAALTDIWSAADRADGPVRTLQEVREERAEQKKRNAPQRFVAWVGGLFSEKASNTAIHIEPTFGDPDSPRAKQILFRSPQGPLPGARVPQAEAAQDLHADDLQRHHDAARHARQPDRQGRAASAFDQSHADQRTLEQELESTEAYYLTAVRRQARIHYMLGMLIGLPLAGLVAYVLYQFNDLPVNMSIAFAAGAAGALVSVMERLTSGKLEMNHEAGRTINVTLGLMRPFIGALFAVALYFFISGDLVSVFQLPDGEQASATSSPASASWPASASGSRRTWWLRASRPARRGAVCPPRRCVEHRPGAAVSEAGIVRCRPRCSTRVRALWPAQPAGGAPCSASRTP